MTGVEIVDAIGAVRAYLSAYPGLTGSGGAIAGGVHQGIPRSPKVGVVCGMQLGAGRVLSDVSDDARLTFTLRARGHETGARALLEAAGRALVRALYGLQDGEQIVQTARGEWVKLLIAGDTSGPSDAGDLAGEVSMVVDATVRCQTSGAPYGAGVYGSGPYGG